MNAMPKKQPNGKWLVLVGGCPVGNPGTFKEASVEAAKINAQKPTDYMSRRRNDHDDDPPPNAA